jgi:Flp pilus assembly protein TadG
MTIALPLFVSLAGLAIDGGALLTSRRELQSLADGAARAGATQLDQQRLRASGGVDVQLDPTLAPGAASTYLAAALQRDASGLLVVTGTQVELGGRRIHVLITARVATAFLRVVHIDQVPVTADAFADVQYGIHDGGGG